MAKVSAFNADVFISFVLIFNFKLIDSYCTELSLLSPVNLMTLTSHGTGTYDYIELCYFLKLLLVSTLVSNVEFVSVGNRAL